MKLKELKQKTDKELRDLLWEKRQKLGKLKFDMSAKKIKNVKQFRELRKEIARIITFLKQRARVK